MAGDGVVVRGKAYGVRSIRVDGNDALAMYSAIHTAREMAISEGRPILIEVIYLCCFLWLYEKHDCETQMTGEFMFGSTFVIARP